MDRRSGLAPASVASRRSRRRNGRRRRRSSTSSTPRPAAPRALPDRAAEPAGPVLLHRARRRSGGVVEAASTWLSTTSLRISMPPARQQRGHQRGVRAAALDERGDAVAAERAQCGVDRERRAPGARTRGRNRLGSRSALTGEVGGRPGAMARAVGRRVGARSPARCRRGRSATCGRRPPTSPHARRPPTSGASVGTPRPTGRTRRRRAATRRVRAAAAAIASRGSQAPVFTLPAWAHTIAGPSERASAAASAAGSMRAVGVGGDARDALLAEAEQPQGGGNGGVHLVADDDLDLPAPRTARAPPSSQPARCSSASRAAARHVTLAI